MRRTGQNADIEDTVHSRYNGYTSRSNTDSGHQDAMNAMWKKVDSEIPATDDIDTISLHLSDGIQNNLNQDWTHSRNIPIIETPDFSIIKCNAREMRRMKIEGESMRQTRDYMSKTDHGDTEECIYTGFYNNHSLVPNENGTINHQMNCFTIINKHYNMKSDSSSDHENCDDVEVIPRNNLEWYDGTFSDAALEYTNDPEKRTIFIYSFKNKPNLLTETEYERVDIPSVSASESSMELEEEAAAAYEKAPNVTATARVATPIPSSYVPRLDLTKGSTLPTVTEITEANTDDDKSPKIFIAKKPKNSWFASDTSSRSRMPACSHHKEEKPSEFKWTPSSARERRRKMFHGDDLKSLQQKTVKTVETSTDHLHDTLENKRSVSSQTTREDIIDIINDNNISDRTKTIAAASNLEDTTNSETHLVTTLKKCGDATPNEEQNDTQISGKEIHQDDTQAETTAYRVTHANLFTGNDKTIPIPRGRYKNLHIKVSPNAKPIFTEPIEDPESDDWICETNNQFSNSYDNIHLQVDNAGTRLLIRNELLLKPSRWDDYSPVADSLPSLQITIGDSDSEHDDTWWRRVLHCVLCR